MDPERERASKNFCPRSGGMMLTSMTKKNFEEMQTFSVARMYLQKIKKCIVCTTTFKCLFIINLVTNIV